MKKMIKKVLLHKYMELTIILLQWQNPYKNLCILWGGLYFTRMVPWIFLRWSNLTQQISVFSASLCFWLRRCWLISLLPPWATEKWTLVLAYHFCSITTQLVQFKKFQFFPEIVIKTAVSPLWHCKDRLKALKNRTYNFKKY
jgi:hypothetical protein